MINEDINKLANSFSILPLKVDGIKPENDDIEEKQSSITKQNELHTSNQNIQNFAKSRCRKDIS